MQESGADSLDFSCCCSQRLSMVPADTGKITHLVCSFPKKTEITSSFCMLVVPPLTWAWTDSLRIQWSSSVLFNWHFIINYSIPQYLRADWKCVFWCVMLFDKSNICQSSVVLKKFLKIPVADSHNSFKVMYNWKPSEVITNLCKMTSLSLWNLPHGGFIKFSAIRW